MDDRSITFFVHGLPTTQGGMRSVTTPAGPRLISSGGLNLKSWRTKITQVAQLTANLQHWATIVDQPVAVSLRFYLQMPSTRPAALRHAGIALHWKRGDIDKLARAVHDSLTVAAIYGDDGQIAVAAQRKYEVLEARHTGVEVTVLPLPVSPDVEAIAALERLRTRYL